MHFKQFVRHFSVTQIIRAAEKSALGTLRKKTGYSFSNCKKALDLHQNDVVKAEKWLHEQAQAMGWAKAGKLEGRATKQGLVGVLVENNIGAMVEVNCETDFVARNKTFQEFVEIALNCCVQEVKTMPTNDVLSKIEFSSDSLKQLSTDDAKKSLGDKLALMIGNVGENASLRRALCFKATNAITLTAFAHPPSPLPGPKPLFGKYGTIVALKLDKPNDEIQRNICQHIIGMNPKKIGQKDHDKPNENKDEESCLIYQEYLLDPSITVDDLLIENSAKIVNFHRYECGESIDDLAANLNVASIRN